MTGERKSIEVQIDRIGNLFNSLAPSPSGSRDLNDDAEEFIVDWAVRRQSYLDTLASNLRKYPVRLCFNHAAALMACPQSRYQFLSQNRPPSGLAGA